jgi:hypothetical protein
LARYAQICVYHLRQKLRQKYLLVLLGLLSLVFSCKKGPGFVRTYGENITVTRTLSEFSSISIGQKFKLYLTQDSSIPEQISITYSQNLMDKIETTVNSGELEIRDRNHYNWVRSLKVQPVCTLNIHKVSKISLHGATSCETLDTLNSHNLRIDANGVGRHFFLLNCGSVSGSCNNAGIIIFKGWGGILAWACENGGWIDASQMKSADAYVYHYTERDIYVDPGIIFKAHVYGKGNVFYYRDPALVFEKKEYGEGRVIKQ